MDSLHHQESAAQEDNYVPVLRWGTFTPYYDFILTISGLGTSFKRKIAPRALDTLIPHAILDIGCGTSTHLQILGTQYPQAHIDGIDPDKALIDTLRTQTPFQNSNIVLHTGSATSLPFTANSFDVCFSTLTFHHLTSQDKQMAFKETYRVLKPGGIFVLTDWGVSRIPFLKWLLIFEEKTLLDDHLAGRIPSFARDAGFLIEMEIRVKPSGIWLWKYTKPHTVLTKESL